ncbi:MAG: hypothetical protein Q7R81_00975 [Candidatus Peregrinibacteria bacterium]|nr:hypothetical protein [Candidatus Peregrinibacteria bacterium]
MRRLCIPALAGLILILSGCVSKYDFDVACSDLDMGVLKANTEGFLCSAPKKFGIKCDARTVQRVGGWITCTTHDGKRIRITITKEPKDDPGAAYYRNNDQK